MDEERYPLACHDLFMIPPNTEHTEESLEDDPLEYIALGIEGIEFLNPENPNNHIIYNYAKNLEFLTLLRFLLGEAQNEQMEYQQICQNILEILLILIMRNQQIIPTSVSNAKMTKECSVIKRYLDSNFSDPINLDSLAEMTHMNKYYMAHAFTKYTGISPMNYLMQRRLKASQELLSSTNHSIAQIASSVGFSSQSYFSQVFKKEHGLSPIEYRKQHNPNSANIPPKSDMDTSAHTVLDTEHQSTI